MVKYNYFVCERGFTLGVLLCLRALCIDLNNNIYPLSERVIDHSYLLGRKILFFTEKIAQIFSCLRFAPSCTCFIFSCGRFGALPYHKGIFQWVHRTLLGFSFE